MINKDKNGALWIEGYHGSENICIKTNRHFIENIAALHSIGFKFSDKCVPSIQSDLYFLKNLLCCSKTCHIHDLSLIDEFCFDLYHDNDYRQILKKIDYLFQTKIFAAHRIQAIPSISESAYCDGFYKINYEFIDIETNVVLDQITLIYEIPYLYAGMENTLIEFSVDQNCLILRDNIIRVKSTPKLQIILDDQFTSTKKGKIKMTGKFTILTEENLLCDFIKEVCCI